MSPLQFLRDGFRDESLRVAILVGLATVPITVVTSLESVSDEVYAIGGSISGGALLLAALVVGYYYHGRETEARRAGIWTGLAGSLGTVVVFGANSITTIAAASWPWIAVATLGTLVAIAFGVGFTVFLTALIVIGIDWVLTRLEWDHRVVDPDSSETIERDDGAFGWWLAIVGYALLAPITFGSLFWLEPVGGAVAFVAVLLLLPTFFLSFATLAGLFVDATAPRDARTDWLPRVWLYVGGPIAAGALVYLFATVRGWGYPPGYAQFTFLAVLWLATAAYLVNRRRYRSNGFQGASAS